MDIKYYYNCNSKVVEAINMDNVKRIYVDYYNCNSKKVSTLYFDEISIHSIYKETMEKKINEIINSEEKILEIYNSDIMKKSLKEESRELIFKNGFLVFKDYFKSNNMNFETVFNEYENIGVRAYVEYIKVFDVMDYNRSIDYIVSFVIISMYLKYIKQLPEEN
mgnify:FL=1